MKITVLFLILFSSILYANDSYKTLNGKPSKLQKALKYIALKSDKKIDINEFKKELFLLNIPEIVSIKRINEGIIVIKFKKELKNRTLFEKYEILPTYNIVNSDQWPFVTDRKIIVKFKKGISNSKKEKIFTKYKLTKNSQFIMDRSIYTLNTIEDAFEISNKLFNLGIFEFAYPDYYMLHKLDFDPNDTYFSNQWHLESSTGGIYAKEAWDINKGSSSIKIAIIDNGMDLFHEDLNITSSHDFSNNPANFTELGDHGTSCAGVAAARGNNSLGVTGLCMNCSIIAAKIMNASGYVLSSASASAMDWSVSEGASVLSNSWGYPGENNLSTYNPALYTAIQTAVRDGRNGKGAIVVFSAGNDHKLFSNESLKGHPDIITVGAINYQNKRSYYSNFGERLDVMAPSNGYNRYSIVTTDIMGGRGYNNNDRFEYSTYDTSYTNTFGGTSSAAPLVSGLIGLMLSENNELTASEIRQILKDTAVKVDVADETLPTGINSCDTRYDAPYDNGHSVCMGYGMINAKAAMEKVQSTHGCTPNVAGEICDNGLDDDCDDLVDNSDPDCQNIDPCENVDCPENSGCGPYENDVACFCHEGYKASNNSCVPIDCSDLECIANSHCDPTDIACYCDNNYKFDTITSSCVLNDPCEGVNCLTWEECNGITGECALKAGNCNINSDCGDSNFECNGNHECIAINRCAGVDCDGHGMCGMFGETPTCTCDEDYFTSEDKKHCISPCKNITCSWNGQCTSINRTTAVCECYSGYHENGLDCVPDATPCDNVDCGVHGKCKVEMGNAVCKCHPGYHDDGLSCVADPTSPCDNVDCGENGSCREIANGAVCDCRTGYHDENLKCVANPTSPCDNVDCGIYGTCRNISDRAVCDCRTGYHDENLKCVEDNNSCGNSCKSWETCNNNNICELKNGACYTDNDCNIETESCDEHKCIRDLCKNVTCSGKGNCKEINNQATCDCFQGYHSESLECVQNNQNNPCEGVSCSGNGTCKVNGTEPSCDCKSGYHAENLECILDITDPCSKLDCGTHGSCKVVSNKAKCECETGYVLSGNVCLENNNLCTNVNCSFHGECIINGNQATCLCDPGYYDEGLNCEMDKSGYEGNGICSYSTKSSNGSIFIIFILLLFIKRKRKLIKFKTKLL